jgi:EF hand
MKLPTAILVAALLSSAAFAQQDPQHSPATPDAAAQRPATPSPDHPVDVGAIFDKLDTNHDGNLTREEAQAHPTVAAHFDEADANHDGVVTKEEFMVAFRPQQ